MKCNNGHFDKDIRSSGITTVDADFEVFSSDIADEDNRTEFNNPVSTTFLKGAVEKSVF